MKQIRSFYFNKSEFIFTNQNKIGGYPGHFPISKLTSQISSPFDDIKLEKLVLLKLSPTRKPPNKQAFSLFSGFLNMLFSPILSHPSRP